MLLTYKPLMYLRFTHARRGVLEIPRVDYGGEVVPALPRAVGDRTSDGVGCDAQEDGCGAGSHHRPGNVHHDREWHTGWGVYDKQASCNG